MKPVRVQRKRTKGWRMPENTVVVSRPSKWGNPFPVGVNGHAMAVYSFRRWLDGHPDYTPAEYALDREFVLATIGSLRGKNLACWCALGKPCHADVLLELANAEEVAR